MHNREIAGLKEALRRANDARQSAEAAAARTAQELRDERRARRTREENAEAETQAAYGHAEGVESQLRQTETELESERARVGREQQRARAFEEDLRKARAELADLTTEMQQTPSRLDSHDALELADVTAAMQRLAVKLESLRARVETSSETPPRLQRRPPADRLARRACRTTTARADAEAARPARVAPHPGWGRRRVAHRHRDHVEVGARRAGHRRLQRHPAGLARRDAGRPTGTPGHRRHRS